MIMRISMPNRFRLKKVMGFRTMIRPERGEIHYIGGADILPAPLSLKEETEALNKFGTEEEKEAKAELIEHNLRLVVYIARDFAFKKKSPILPIIYETKRGIKIRNKNYSFFMYKQSKRTPFRV